MSREEEEEEQVYRPALLVSAHYQQPVEETESFEKLMWNAEYQPHSARMNLPAAAAAGDDLHFLEKYVILNPRPCVSLAVGMNLAKVERTPIVESLALELVGWYLHL